MKKTKINNKIAEELQIKDGLKKHPMLKIIYEIIIRPLLIMRFILSIPLIIVALLMQGSNVFIYLSFCNKEELDDGMFIV